MLGRETNRIKSSHTSIFKWKLFAMLAFIPALHAGLERAAMVIAARISSQTCRNLRCSRVDVVDAAVALLRCTLEDAISTNTATANI